MAVDMIVKSFLILFSVVCIVRYGSCAPIEEHIVLDNGTVLTMVIHDVQEAPPPRYSDSSIDVNSTDDKDNKPMIVIPEPQYAPAPRLISKRSADPGNTGDQDADGKGEVKEPILPSTPRIEISKELGGVSTPSAVEDGAQTKKDVQGPGLDEKGVSLHSETAKVTEKPKSTELQENGDDQPEDEDEEEEKVIIGKEQDRTTPVAVPTEPIKKDGTSESSDAVDGSNSPEEKTEDAGDGNAKNGNSADDESEKPDVATPDEGRDNAPIDEDLNKKSSTENRDNELVNEAKDESTSKPSVSTPSDESSDDGEETDDENGDPQIDDNNANGKEDSEDDEEEGYEYEDNDPNSNKSEGNAASDEPEDDNEEEENGDADDNELDENYSKGRPANSGEISDSEGGSSTSKKDVSKTQSSGHFMSYFLIAVVFVACFYLVFHNRQKIKAYVLEGKTGRARRRKAGNAEYRQLSTAEEVLPSADKGIESKITYTY